MTVKRSKNVTQKLLTELQALIAYASYDSPSLSCGGSSMTDEAQEILMSKLCFGSPDDDPDKICLVDQLLHGLNMFSGLFTVSSDEAQPSGADTTSTITSEMLLTLSPTLHQLGPEVNVFVGEGSIEKSLLCGKTLRNSASFVTGRTMLRHAKDVLCNCKKMTAIVTASNSPYKNGNFPSGTNWDDYIKWCLIAMYKLTASVSTIGNTSSSLSTTGAACAVDTSFTTISDAGDSNNNNLATTEQQLQSPDNRDKLNTAVAAIAEDAGEGSNDDLAFLRKGFFKGFFAWCLWGHIPINGDGEMKSLQFTDSKVPTTFGRGSGSRRALKSTSATSLSLLPDDVRLDNRRGSNKRNRADSPKDDATLSVLDDDAATMSILATAQDDNKILKEALDYLDGESLEKARRNHAMLSCLQVRDEISSLKGRLDGVSRRYYHANEGSPRAEALLEKMDELEEMLREQEKHLAFLQKEEATRQLLVIAERDAIRRDRSASALPTASSIPTVASSNDNRLFCTPVRVTLESPEEFAGVAVSFSSPKKTTPEAGAEAMLAMASGNMLVCVDCRITPTAHTCRKCKQYVCDICCSTRGMEMIWWCSSCFDCESATNQQLICQGNYESDSNN